MNPLYEVTEKEIAGLSPVELAEIVNRLLHAEASKFGLSPANVQTSLRINDPDGGVDARVVDMPDGSRWIPKGLSVWQFKSGKDHEAKKIENTEFPKSGVQDAIRQGGSYVLVTADDLNTPKIKQRRDALDACCKSTSIPLERCCLYSAGQLRQWISEHLAVSLLPPFNRAPGKLFRWEEWAGQPRFSQPFVSDLNRDRIMKDALPSLVGRSDTLHIRVEELAGVGKTRLALEMFRSSEASGEMGGLAERTVYADNPQSIPDNLFALLASNAESSLILVVDECEEGDAETLEPQIQRCGGRVRLLTIGIAKEAKRTITWSEGHFYLQTLDDEAMRRLLHRAVPTLPQEQVGVISRLVSGFVKLATVLANIFQKNPASVTELLGDEAVIGILRKFLLPDDRDYAAMQAVAILSRVGWEGELDQEGRTIVEFMGLNWRDAQRSIQRFVREELVSVQRRYRYVTPHLLAVWLSADAWETHSDLLNLIDVLPTWNCRRALLERLHDMQDHPRAKQVVEMLLAPDKLFPDLTSLDDDRRAEIFSILAETHPIAGVRALQHLLDSLPRDDLVQFEAGRSRIVWTLQHLAWYNETFFEAARLLLRLAETENERWANTASGIWSNLFLTYLGGTEVPAITRHALIREALESDSVQQQLIAVRAIEASLTYQEIGSMRDGRAGTRIMPAEWRPKTRLEDREVRLSALVLLDIVLNSEQAEVRQAAEQTLINLMDDLSILGLAEECVERLERLPIPTDSRRRELHDALTSTLQDLGARIDPVVKPRIEALRARLVGTTFRDRLRRWVGEWSRSDWLAMETPRRSAVLGLNARGLAEEAMQNPELLIPELDWLFTNEAVNVSAFALRLGELDIEKYWWAALEMRNKQGMGFPVTSTYLQGHVEAGRCEWRDTVLDEWVMRGADRAFAVLDAVWRGAANDQDVDRLVMLIQHGSLPPEAIRTLVWGGQTKPFSAPAFQCLIETVLDLRKPEAASAAIDLLEQRLDFHPDDMDVLEPLVWTALERYQFLSEDAMARHDRGQLLQRLVSRNPARVVRVALDPFKRHVEQNRGYIRLSEETEVLQSALTIDPQAVWQQLATYLLSQDKFSLLLSDALEDWRADTIGEDILLAWAEENTPDGPHIVASLASVGEVPMNRLARELLIRFGKDKRVQSALSANFWTDSWWGPASDHYKDKLRPVQEWLKDLHPAVRKWAQVQSNALEKMIADAELEEAEGVLV